MEPFVPSDLPVEIDYTNLIREISQAHHNLGNLSGSILHPGVNPHLLVKPLLTKEAVLSSSIEGTVATLENVFQYEADAEVLDSEELRRDAQEVVNYRRAMEASLEELERRAIGENLLKRAHVILLDSVRGERKSRGQFRRQQVFVGKPGSTIGDASFIPAPPEEIFRLIRNWEEYINSDKEKDPLVQVAVAHYQFEAIHPFLDGNGRIGRLVIPLFLCERQLLPEPILYVSGYFEGNRDSYIEALRAVDERSDWEHWIKFFLKGIQVQALRTQESVLQIMSLYDELKEEITAFGSVYAGSMLDAMFVRPIVNYRYLRSQLSASPQTIYNLLEKFEQANVLIRVPGRERNRIYIFERLMRVLG